MISYRDEKISISKNILLALIVSVVADPVNANEKIEGAHTITLGSGAAMNLHELWGGMDQILDITGYNND